MATIDERIKQAQDAWKAANATGDKAGMDAAHAAAEAARAEAGYSGGADGSKINVTDQNKYDGYVLSKNMPIIQPLPQVPNFSGNINSMYDAQLAAEMAALNSARDQANSDYQAQIDQAPETFRPMKDAVDVSTVRNIQRANEVAAFRGTTFEGGVQSDQGAMVASGEQQKTTLNQQEVNLVQSLKKAIADNNKATSYKAVELNAQNTAARNQALLNEGIRVDDATYNRGVTNQQLAQNVAGLTGYYGGARTLAGQSLDQNAANDAFQRGVTEAQLTGTYKGQPTLAASQWLKTFDYQKERDKVSDGQWLKVFEQNKAEAAAGRAIQWANYRLNRDQYEWSRDPSNPDNIYKMVQIAAKDAGTEAAAFEDTFKKAWDMIGATKKTFDPSVGQYVESQMYTPDQVGNMIDQSSLSDEEALRLRKMLNIPLPK